MADDEDGAAFGEVAEAGKFQNVRMVQQER